MWPCRQLRNHGLTKATTGHGVLLAKLIIALSQILTAEDLVGLSDLSCDGISSLRCLVREPARTAWNLSCAVASPGFLSALCISTT